MLFPARLGLLALVLLATGAHAQTIYRHVDANGKVSFSDKAPDASAQPALQGNVPPNLANPGLPYELRQVVQRYPVTLYTQDECGPCEMGRTLLRTRGVPFNERTVKSPADSAALEQLSGQRSLPLLSIGAQQVRGFSDAEWSQYLDAAGYPKSSQLPAGFAMPPATPLVALQPAKAAEAPQAPAAAPAAPPSAPRIDGPTPSNPAGIAF